MLRRSVKWKWVAAALVLVAAAIVVPVALPPDRNRNEGASTVTSCGGKRWPVKTLADPGGRGLRLDLLQATTIDVLRQLPARPGGESSRGGTVERTVYRVAARLVAAKVIGEDSDIHLVIADPKTGGPLAPGPPSLILPRRATRPARAPTERRSPAPPAPCGPTGPGRRRSRVQSRDEAHRAVAALQARGVPLVRGSAR